jgi:hypothetical protein
MDGDYKQIPSDCNGYSPRVRYFGISDPSVNSHSGHHELITSGAGRSNFIAALELAARNRYLCE